MVISHLVEHKTVLEYMSIMPIVSGRREVGISSTDWLAFSHMVEVLKPFKETTNVFCICVASLEEVIPLIHSLNYVLESTLPQGSSLFLWTTALVLRLWAGMKK